jgi:hypothetical protein
MTIRARLGVLVALLVTASAVVVPRAWGWWVSQPTVSSTITAGKLATITPICTMTDQAYVLVVATGYYTGMRINATVPTPTSNYTYTVALARRATPNTPIWTKTVTPSSTGALIYTFTDSDITTDQPTATGTQNDHDIDYTVTVTAALKNTSWTTSGVVHMNAWNSSGVNVLGVHIGGDVYYGTQTGSTSAGGSPGECATS